MVMIQNWIPLIGAFNILLVSRLCIFWRLITKKNEKRSTIKCWKLREKLHYSSDDEKKCSKIHLIYKTSKRYLCRCLFNIFIRCSWPWGNINFMNEFTLRLEYRTKSKLISIVSPLQCNGWRASSTDHTRKSTKAEWNGRHLQMLLHLVNL